MLREVDIGRESTLCWQLSEAVRSILVQELRVAVEFAAGDIPYLARGPSGEPVYWTHTLPGGAVSTDLGAYHCWLMDEDCIADFGIGGMKRRMARQMPDCDGSHLPDFYVGGIRDLVARGLAPAVAYSPKATEELKRAMYADTPTGRDLVRLVQHMAGRIWTLM